MKIIESYHISDLSNFNHDINEANNCHFYHFVRIYLIQSMNTQCLGGLKDFHLFIQGDSYARVLSLSSFSHILDPRHLAAAIWGLSQQKNIGEIDDYEKGRENLKHLLEGAIDNSIGEKASLIMKIKLQQILFLINEKSAQNSEILSLKL